MTQTNPPVTEEAVERVANDFAVKVTEHAVMELDADEENTAQIEAFGLLVEQEFRIAIAALKSPPIVSEGMLISNEVLLFLKGQGPLEGRWFGEGPPDGERGNFWWRKYLPSTEALAMSVKSEAESGKRAEMTKYRIDQHGPYRRWIVVRDGVDISAHATRVEAELALAQLKAQGMSASGQDREAGLEAKPASPVAESDAPKEHPTQEGQ